MSGWKHAEKPIQPILLHAPERENEENEPFVTVLRKLRQPTLKGDAACREHSPFMSGLGCDITCISVSIQSLIKCGLG